MALPEKLRKNMERFQVNDGVPVYLKGGPADKVLFGITVAACGLGIFTILKMAYEMGSKKK